MRTLALILTLALCGTGTAGPEHSVLVRAELGGGCYACGSGTVVRAAGGRSYVLTCAHVADAPGHRYSVLRWEDGKLWSYAAKYVAGNRVRETGPGTIEIDGSDLSLLVVPGFELPSAAVASADPEPGAPVSQWGYGSGQAGPADYRQRHRRGQFFAVVDEGSFVSSIRCVEGDSGGGVFDAKDQLVGVCHSRPSNPAEAGPIGQYAVPRASVVAFLAAHLPKPCDCPGCGCEKGKGCGCETCRCPSCPAAVFADYDAAVREAKRRGVPLLLLLTTDPCPPCTRLKKELADPAMREKLARYVVCELRRSDYPQAAATFGVQSFPSLILATPGGGFRRLAGLGEVK